MSLIKAKMDNTFSDVWNFIIKNQNKKPSSLICSTWVFPELKNKKQLNALLSIACANLEIRDIESQYLPSFSNVVNQIKSDFENKTLFNFYDTNNDDQTDILKNTLDILYKHGRLNYYYVMYQDTPLKYCAQNDFCEHGILIGIDFDSELQLPFIDLALFNLNITIDSYKQPDIYLNKEVIKNQTIKLNTLFSYNEGKLTKTISLIDCFDFKRKLISIPNNQPVINTIEPVKQLFVNYHQEYHNEKFLAMLLSLNKNHHFNPDTIKHFHICETVLQDLNYYLENGLSISNVEFIDNYDVNKKQFTTIKLTFNATNQLMFNTIFNFTKYFSTKEQMDNAILNMLTEKLACLNTFTIENQSLEFVISKTNSGEFIIHEQNQNSLYTIKHLLNYLFYTHLRLNTTLTTDAVAVSNIIFKIYLDNMDCTHKSIYDAIEDLKDKSDYLNNHFMNLVCTKLKYHINFIKKNKIIDIRDVTQFYQHEQLLKDLMIDDCKISFDFNQSVDKQITIKLNKNSAMYEKINSILVAIKNLPSMCKWSSYK